MTDDTIPLEAGIESRAISFTKGCYVGQEVIIRVLHRGHGRVVRKLVSLRINGQRPQSGAKLYAGEREAGVVTSAGESPRSGTIALGYAHRDFIAAGTELEVEMPSGRVPAVVTEIPVASAV
jgi:folate-binding protein YgfZ